MKTIHHVVDVDADTDIIWSAVTERDRLARWWSTGLDTPPATIGALQHWTFAGDFNPMMEITALDPPVSVEWTCRSGHANWQDNTFRFELVELDGGRTRLRFWQHYATELSDDDYGTYNFNWAYYLESLRLLCTTGTGKPFQPPADSTTGDARPEEPTTTEMISIATARAKPECVEELERELRARIEVTRAQPGNLAFSLHRLTDDPTSVVAYEHWASRSDWERHMQGDHITSLMAVFDRVLAAPPEIEVLVPLED